MKIFIEESVWLRKDRTYEHDFTEDDMKEFFESINEEYESPEDFLEVAKDYPGELADFLENKKIKPSDWYEDNNDYSIEVTEGV